MALSRRTGTRFQASIWPGFVDAMTGLLLVLMFVLTIFMVVQFVLTERITGQETELDQLAAEVTSLSVALGLSQQQTSRLLPREVPCTCVRPGLTWGRHGPDAMSTGPGPAD